MPSQSYLKMQGITKHMSWNGIQGIFTKVNLFTLNQSIKKCELSTKSNAKYAKLKQNIIFERLSNDNFTNFD